MNDNLPQELQKKAAELEMEETQHPERCPRAIQDPEPERSYRRPDALEMTQRQLEQMELNKGQEIPREPQQRTQQSIDLFKAWMEFIYSERTKNGLYDRLPRLGRQRCNCAKSQIGYPHWQPRGSDGAIRISSAGKEHAPKITDLLFVGVLQ